MRELRPYIVDLNHHVDDLLKRLPIFDDSLEKRFHLALSEKKAMITEVLNELDKQDTDDENVKRLLKIIYRDDEVEKLNFHAWKRLCQQNNTLESSVLEEMGESFSHMKSVLEKVAEGTDHLPGREIRFVAPTLYK